MLLQVRFCICVTVNHLQYLSNFGHYHQLQIHCTLCYVLFLSPDQSNPSCKHCDLQPAFFFCFGTCVEMAAAVFSLEALQSAILSCAVSSEHTWAAQSVTKLKLCASNAHKWEKVGTLIVNCCCQCCPLRFTSDVYLAPFKFRLGSIKRIS